MKSVNPSHPMLLQDPGAHGRIGQLGLLSTHQSSLLASEQHTQENRKASGQACPLKACEQAEKAKGQRPQPGRGRPPATCADVEGVPRALGQPLLTLAENPPPRCYWGRSPRPREASAHSDHARAGRSGAAKGPLPTWRPPPHQALPRLPLGALEFPGAGAPRAPPEAGHLPFRAPPSAPAPTPTCSGRRPLTGSQHARSTLAARGRKGPLEPPGHAPTPPAGRASPGVSVRSRPGHTLPGRAPGPSPPGRRWGLEAAPSGFDPPPRPSAPGAHSQPHPPPPAFLARPLPGALPQPRSLTLRRGPSQQEARPRGRAESNWSRWLAAPSPEGAKLGSPSPTAPGCDGTPGLRGRCSRSTARESSRTCTSRPKAHRSETAGLPVNTLLQPAQRPSAPPQENTAERNPGRSPSTGAEWPEELGNRLSATPHNRPAGGWEDQPESGAARAGTAASAPNHRSPAPPARIRTTPADKQRVTRRARRRPAPAAAPSPSPAPFLPSGRPHRRPGGRAARPPAAGPGPGPGPARAQPCPAGGGPGTARSRARGGGGRIKRGPPVRQARLPGPLGAQRGAAGTKSRRPPPAGPARGGLCAGPRRAPRSRTRTARGGRRAAGVPPLARTHPARRGPSARPPTPLSRGRAPRPAPHLVCVGGGAPRRPAGPPAASSSAPPAPARAARPPARPAAGSARLGSPPRAPSASHSRPPGAILEACDVAPPAHP
ncbi:PREDICTED: basic proline-rich protein-like [Capra hircus]|uniref:basic proline-rich protein-like n=1 Tax=Capra hircus TaxID=9925 RepID=UPI000846C76E|nr:PREDICTED: basic proline-rich protein-like [Capra hircus]